MRTLCRGVWETVHLCVYVCVYKSVSVSASTHVFAVAIRLIMPVWYVCRILMIIYRPSMNTEVSVKFRGSGFKVRGNGSDEEARREGEQRDTQRESEIRTAGS